MPTRKALLIGVGNYETLPPLRSPSHNLHRLERVLSDEELGGFMLHGGRSYRDETASELRRLILEFFSEAAADDLLLLYYAGHGLTDPDDVTNLYLAGTDSHPHAPDLNSVAKDFIVKRINKTNAAQIVLLFDCCFSGRFTKSLKFKRSNQSIDIITSTNSTKYSFEPTESELSQPLTYFTAALLNGIERGMACRGNESHISTGAIFKYVEQELLVRQPNQHPQSLSNTGSRPLHLSRNPYYHRIPPTILTQIESSDAALRIAAIENYLNPAYTQTENDTYADQLRAQLQKLQQDPDPAVVRVAEKALKKSPPGTPVARPPVLKTVAVAYLRWLIELHAYLRLYGIQAAQDFPGVPLEQVYVALRGEKSSSYEKMKARERVRSYIIHQVGEQTLALMDEDRQYELELDYITQDPVLPSFEQQDSLRADFEIPVTLGEAFRDERFLVILGDPGSGKSTLAKWLALQLATSFLRQLKTGKPERVSVPEHQIDPFLEQSTLYDLGPARFPVLISIAGYAQAFQDRKQPLIDYLGEQTWDDYRPRYSSEQDIPAAHLKETIAHYLKNGEAVIILDGLDEVTQHRREIVAQVEDFITTWIIRQGKDSTDSKTPINWSDYHTPPGTEGGNQVIITSRIVGYHLARITNSITHVVIEPMRRTAISRFCHVWMEAAIRAEPAYQNRPKEAALRAKSEAKKLEQSIFEDKRIIELASNPLIITILALVFRNNNGVLPVQRAALYQEALRTLVENWRATDLTLPEVEYVLSAVARKIHQEYARGLIKGAELREIIKENLAEIRPDSGKRLPADYGTTVERFISEINDKVGIIAPRGHEAYGFLHLTFQEYLAARFITRNEKDAEKSILQYMDNPRWKVPLLMSLGHVSVDDSWGPRAISRLLDKILRGNSVMNDYFPRTALFLAEALQEMSLEKVDRSFIERVVLQLLRFYNQQDRVVEYPQLKQQIERAIQAIRQSEKGNVIDDLFCNILTTTDPELRDLSTVCADLIYRNCWFGKRIVQHLYLASRRESPEGGGIIHRSLLKLACGSIGFDEPREPELPDTPQSIYEKQIEEKRQELIDLRSGALAGQLKKRLNELQQQLPLLDLERRLHDLSDRSKLINKYLTETNTLLEQALNGELKSSLAEERKQFARFERILPPQTAEDQRMIALAQERVKAIDHTLNEIESGSYIELLNEEIRRCTQALAETGRQQKLLEDELRQHQDAGKFNELLQKILSEPNHSSDGTRAGHDQQAGWERLFDRLRSGDTSPWQKPVTNTSTKAYIQAQAAIDNLAIRLRRIADGTEKEAILDEINHTRERIRKKDFSYEDYRFLRQCFDHSYRYYEAGKGKYERQEYYPFSAYGLPRPRLPIPATWETSGPPIDEPGFSQLLILSALLGGFLDSNQVEVTHTYEEVATFLAKSNAERLAIIAQQPESYYGRYGYQDPIYGAAVQLDTRQISIEDHVTVTMVLKAPLTFSADYFYRNAALPEPTFQRLLRASSRAELQRELNMARQHATDPEELIDIHIALIPFQDNGPAVVDFIEQTAEPVQLLQQLALSCNAFREPIFRSITPHINRIAELTSELPEPEWLEVYRAVLQTITLAYGRPILKAHFLDVAPLPFYPLLLANHWYTYFTIYTEDRDQVIRSLIEQFSGEGAVPSTVRSALLQLPDAPLFELRHRLKLDTDWELKPYVSDAIFRPDEIPFDALTALENFHLIDHLPNGVGQFFKTTYLSGLLGLQEKEHPQCWEIYLFCLQNQLYGNGLEEYLPETLRSSHFLTQTLYPAVDALRDRYYSCRALLRYLPYAGERRQEVWYSLERKAIKIKDAFERAQILGHLINLTEDPERLETFRRHFLTALQAIDRPLSQIKILLDQRTLLEDTAPELFRSLLLAAIPRIADNYTQARTIRRLLKQTFSPTLHNEIVALAHRFTNPFLTSIALDLVAVDLLVNERFTNAFKGPLHCAPLLLFGAFDQLCEYFQYSGTTTNQELPIAELWHDLEQHPAQEQVKRLIIRGSQDGLRLDATSVAVMQRILASDAAPTVFPLLPLLDTPLTSVLPTLRSWLESPHSTVRDHAALYLAEFDAIDAATIGGVLRLSTYRDSRSLYRANIQLSRGITRVKRFPLPYLLSQLDEALIKQLLQYTLYLRSRPKESLARFYTYDIIGDSIPMIEKHLREIYANGPDKSLAIEFFSTLSYLTPAAEDFLADFLEQNGIDPALDKGLVSLVSAMFIHHRNNECELRFRLVETMVKLIPERLSEIRYFARHANDILTVLQQANRENDSQPENLDKRATAITENVYDLLRRPFDQIEPLLEDGLYPATGYHYYDKYYFRKREEIEIIRNAYSDTLFELLLNWIMHIAPRTGAENGFLDIRKELLLIILAIWTDERNISLFNSYDRDGQLYRTLLRFLSDPEISSVGRMATLQALSYLDRHTTAGLRIVEQFLTARPVVRNAASQIFQRMRQVDEPLVDYLTDNLRTAEPLVAYNYIQILRNYAKDDSVKPQVREQIIRSFTEAVGDHQMVRGVYTYVGEATPEAPYRVEFQDRLDLVLFDALLDVCGVVSSL